MELAVACGATEHTLVIEARFLDTANHDLDAERIAFSLGANPDLPNCVLIAFAWEAIADHALWVRRLRRTADPKAPNVTPTSNLNHLQIANNVRAMSIRRVEERRAVLAAELEVASTDADRRRLERKFDHADRRLRLLQSGAGPGPGWATLRPLRQLSPEAISLLTSEI